MNVQQAFAEGRAGKNKGLSTGILSLDRAMGGVQRKHIYGIAASPKVGKCLAKGTEVIMYDLSKKKVEDLKEGDLLLGLDGFPNKILSTVQGTEEMYMVHQSKSISYGVNKSHILSLKDRDDKVRNITISEYLNQSFKSKKYDSYGYKSLAIFDEKSVLLDPYFLGLWLGDGTSDGCSITNVETEVLSYLNSIPNITLIRRDDVTVSLKSTKVLLKINPDTLEVAGKYSSVVEAATELNTLSEYISRATKDDKIVKGFKWKWETKNNHLLLGLQHYNLIKNKHIPLDYIRNSEETRLQVLAGLIDSDGYLQRSRCAFEITQKNSRLAEEILFLANSLGFTTTFKIKVATMKRYDGSVYKCKVCRIVISGDVTRIPVLVQRKKASKRLKSVHSKILVKYDKVGEYYGFCLENEDKRFYLSDFTVTHNTTLADFCFVLSPYEDAIARGILGNYTWIYFSFEIDRVNKEFKYIAHYIAKDYGIYNFMYNGKLYGMSADYLMGKKVDDTGNPILVSDEHAAMVKDIYFRRIIPLFGEFDFGGRKIRNGKIEFIEEKDNPTGLRNYLMSIAKKHGVFIEETYQTYNPDTKKNEARKRITGYKLNPDSENVNYIVITDHIRKLKLERGFLMKQNVDKYIEYQVELRNWCGTLFTFVDICHLNRAISSVERMKYGGEFLYPTGDDLKDTGNLSEDAEVLITMFNPNDEKYGLERHFGKELISYPNYRSLHIVEARHVECPVHMQTNMFGGVNQFVSIQ